MGGCAFTRFVVLYRVSPILVLDAVETEDGSSSTKIFGGLFAKKEMRILQGYKIRNGGFVTDPPTDGYGFPRD